MERTKMERLTSLEQAVIELFPNAPITGNAYRKAQAYINAAIEVRGLVESFMFALRDPDSNELSDVYFPKQIVSKNGFRVGPREVLEAAEAIFQMEKRMAGLIHSHRYGPLFPSGPYLPELNDRDHNKLILDEAGASNCKTKTVKITEKDMSIALDSYSVFTPERRLAFGPVSIRSHYNMKKCIISLIQHYFTDKENFDGFEAPINFNYIYSIIMNPSIPQKSSRYIGAKDYLIYLLNAPIGYAIDKTGVRRDVEKWCEKKFEKRIRKLGIEDDWKDIKQALAEPETTEYQKDIYNDPYAEVVWKPQSPVTALPHTCNELQLPLVISENGEPEQIDYKAIKQEVRQKTKRRPVQLIESLKNQGLVVRDVFSNRGGYYY